MSGLLNPRRRQAVLVGLVVAGLAYFPILVLREPFLGFDAYAYWSVDLARLYSQSVGDPGLFPYSPAAAVVAQLFGLVPWPLFLVGWWTLLIAVLAWLAARTEASARPTLRATLRGLLILLAFLPIQMEIVTGNIHLLMAAAIVVGFRFPAAWALVLLTKVTAGVGLLWFVLRREWRQLAIALAVTAAIAAATFVALPDLWLRWVDFLRSSAANPSYGLPLWMRLPFAVGLIWWGARRDARWTLPAATMLALPVLWVSGLAMLAGSWALWGWPARKAADAPASAKLQAQAARAG
jgi:hypothetical protein